MSKHYLQEFSESEFEYYSRQMVLKEMGVSGQLKLKKARVCVVGMGGLGSSLAFQLASMGIGHLRIVDRDVVEMSNLQRQHLYDTEVVGYPKVEAAASKLKRLNPHIKVEPFPLSLNNYNAERIVNGMDVVVDGLDSLAPRYALNRACVNLGIPYVYGAAITHIGSVTTLIPGETPCLECFQGNMDDYALPTCAVAGIHPSILSIVASIQVSEAIRILTDRTPNLVNKLLFCDLENLSFEKIKLVKVEKCPICGVTQQSKKLTLPRENHGVIEEICGRERRRVFIITPENYPNYDLEELNKILVNLGYSLDVKANLGLSFSNKSGVKGSILMSGVAILEGLKDKKEAKSLYDRILAGAKPSTGQGFLQHPHKKGLRG